MGFKSGCSIRGGEMKELRVPVWKEGAVKIVTP